MVKAVLPSTISLPPNLESCVVDKNDKTGESGFWMNRADILSEVVWRESVRSTIVEFSKDTK